MRKVDFSWLGILTKKVTESFLCNSLPPPRYDNIKQQEVIKAIFSVPLQLCATMSVSTLRLSASNEGGVHSFAKLRKINETAP
jgi:hypothetical protein